MSAKERLHELVEQLPDSEVEAAERMQRGLCTGRHQQTPRRPPQSADPHVAAA